MRAIRWQPGIEGVKSAARAKKGDITTVEDCYLQSPTAMKFTLN
jgi:hypothetical protein